MVDKRKAKNNFKELKVCAKAIMDLAEDTEGMYLDEDYEGAEFSLGGIEDEISSVERLIREIGCEVEERIEKIQEVEK